LLHEQHQYSQQKGCADGREYAQDHHAREQQHDWVYGPHDHSLLSHNFSG
jgi:hypothetical protein